MPEKKPTLQQLAALQESGIPYLLVDSYTDCRDFWSLTVGSRQKPAHLHPSDPRSQNSRTHQMDDTHPNAINDERSIDQGDGFATSTFF